MALNKIEYLKKRREKGKGHRCIRGYWHTGAEHAVISLLSVTPFLPLLLHLQANKHRRRKKTKNPRKTNLCCTTSLHKKNSDNFQLKENVSIEKILLNQQSFIYRARTNTEQCFDEADQATLDQTMPGFIFKTE